MSSASRVCQVDVTSASGKHLILLLILLILLLILSSLIKFAGFNRGFFSPDRYMVICVQYTDMISYILYLFPIWTSQFTCESPELEPSESRRRCLAFGGPRSDNELTMNNLPHGSTSLWKRYMPGATHSSPKTF